MVFKRIKHHQAFTLLEILLVVAAIAILATIVIVAINPQRQLSQFRDTQREAHLNQLNSALTQYLIEGNSLPEEITTVPKEICNTGQTPGEEEPQPDCGELINLSFLVPTYIPRIPNDPTQSTSAFLSTTYAQTLSGNGYYIGQGQAGRIFLSAPKSETKSLSLGQADDTYSLEFDGSSGYVDINNPGFNNSDDITILAWAKGDFDKRSGLVYAGHVNGQVLGVRGNRMHAFIDGNTVETDAGVYDLADGSWYFFAITFDGTTFRQFVDGYLVNSQDMGYITSSGWRIGMSTAADRRFPGLINNPRIYNRALSEQEIQNLYNSIHISEGLVGWWNFNEGEGITTEDLSGNENHGTIHGGVTWTTDTP